jgi:RNA polymerase sigma factor (sigma-70 family)
VSAPQARSDAELAVRLQRGDTAALGQLYDRHVRGIHDFLARFTRDPSAAEDLAQSTFLRAWERRETLRDPSKVRAWLYATAHNLALNHVTRSRPAGSTDNEAAGGIADPRRGPEEEAIAQDAGDLVWAAASSLEARQYAVLDLSVRRGLSTREIADALGVSVGHAAVLLNRSREALGNAVRYLLVARRRDHCERLAALVPAGVRALTAQQRSAVDHHMRRCESCQALGRRLTAPAELLGALLPVPLPAGLAGDGRERLVAAVRSLPGGHAAQGQPSGGGSWPPRRRPWDRRPGPAAGLATMLVLLLLGGGVAAYMLRPQTPQHTASGGPRAAGGGPAVAATPVTAESPSPSPSGSPGLAASPSPVAGVSPSARAAIPPAGGSPGGGAGAVGAGGGGGAGQPTPVATVVPSPGPTASTGPTPTPIPAVTPAPTPVVAVKSVTLVVDQQLLCRLPAVGQLLACFTVTVDLTSAPGQALTVTGTVTANGTTPNGAPATQSASVRLTLAAGISSGSASVAVTFPSCVRGGTASAATAQPSTVLSPAIPLPSPIACLGS